MNQTIEQQREQAARRYVGSWQSKTEQAMTIATYKKGAEWEYNRSKWHDIADGLPNLKGWYLIRLCVSCDPQLLFYDADKLHYAWSEVISWAEIPL